MLKIRLQRGGRTNDPSYRVVVCEHTSSPKAGTNVDMVGTYDPVTKQRNLKADRIQHWIKMGAQPSPTVHNMLISAGIIKGKKINVLPQKSPPAKAAVAAEAVASSPSAPAAAEETAPEAPQETPAA